MIMMMTIKRAFLVRRESCGEGYAKGGIDVATETSEQGAQKSQKE